MLSPHRYKFFLLFYVYVLNTSRYFIQTYFLRYYLILKSLGFENHKYLNVNLYFVAAAGKTCSRIRIAPAAAGNLQRSCFRFYLLP
jgi:hypothetical protein